MRIGKRKQNKYAAPKDVEQAKDIEQTTDSVDCSDLSCEKECIERAPENSGEAVNEKAIDTANGNAVDATNGNSVDTANENAIDAESGKPIDNSSAKARGKKAIKRAASKKGVEYVEVGGYHSEVVVKEKVSTLRKLSAIWTLISTAYAIVSTCLFVSRDWVSSTASYVLIGILSAYILAFIGLVIFVIRNPKKGTRTAKYYKTILKIYKVIINITFLILTAVSMAGMAATDMSAGKWFMFIMSFVVAFVQLGFKLALLGFKIARRWVAKRFKVKIVNYRNGKKKKNTMLDGITERQYKDKD